MSLAALDADNIGRFLSKLPLSSDPSQCWNWQGTMHHTGYGVFKLDGRMVFSHRLSLLIKLGRNLRPNHFACHTCDNKQCCNPAHLYEGSQSENGRDFNERGDRSKIDSARKRNIAAVSRETLRENGRRNVKQLGNKGPMALRKFTPDQVRLIRTEYDSRRSDGVQLAQRFGVSHPTIMKIVKRVRYRDVPDAVSATEALGCSE